MDEQSLAKGVEALVPLCLPDGMAATDIGTMTSERWKRLHDQLIEIEMIDSPLNVDEAFDVSFLKSEQ